MPEIVKILTDDHDMITHLLSMQEEYLAVCDVAKAIYEGQDYFVTFGDVVRYPLTFVVEDGHLRPMVDDPQGSYTIWDLPREEDPAEEEFEMMYDAMRQLDEFERGNERMLATEEIRKYL